VEIAKRSRCRKKVNPKLVFDRLFSSRGSAERVQRDAARKSILDFIRDDSRTLADRVSANDKKQKLDEYFSSIRDIELRMERAATLPPANVPPGITAPRGIPRKLRRTSAPHVRTCWCSLSSGRDRASALWFLQTRAANKSYPELGVNEGHHELSHHGPSGKKSRKVREINKFHVAQFAYL